MITRSLVLRHGRRAIHKSTSPSIVRQCRRALSTTPPSEANTPQHQSEPHDAITANWEFFQHQRRVTGNVGAKVAPHYRPNNLIKNPPRPQDITLELLLAAQTHLGHRTSLWHPANARYIFGTWGQTHDAIHVISLDVTAAHLRRACKVVSGVAARGGVILFVGTRDGHALPVVRAAQLAGGCHLFDKWIPGTLTNGQQILGKCGKKVVNELDEELLGFDNQLAERAAIKPDLVVCLNPLENYVLLHECGIHNIPTIGIIDTDVNPTWVTYPIPANDDSIRSISTIAGALGRAGQAGQRLRLENAKAGIIEYEAAHGLQVPTREEVQAAKRRKEDPTLDDHAEDEAELLTEAEQAIYTAVEAPVPPQSAQEIEEEDVMHEGIPETSDDTLISLIDFAEERNADIALTKEDRDLLAASQENITVAHDSAPESQPRQPTEQSMAETSSPELLTGPDTTNNEVVDDVVVSDTTETSGATPDVAAKSALPSQSGGEKEEVYKQQRADNQNASEPADTFSAFDSVLPYEIDTGLADRRPHKAAKKDDEQ